MESYYKIVLGFKRCQFEYHLGTLIPGFAKHEYNPGFFETDTPLSKFDGPDYNYIIDAGKKINDNLEGSKIDWLFSS